MIGTDELRGLEGKKREKETWWMEEHPIDYENDREWNNIENENAERIHSHKYIDKVSKGSAQDWIQ